MKDTQREFHELLDSASAPTGADAGDDDGGDDDEEGAAEERLTAAEAETTSACLAVLASIQELLREAATVATTLPVEAAGAPAGIAWLDGVAGAAEGLAAQATDVGMALYPPQDGAELAAQLHRMHALLRAAKEAVAGGDTVPEAAREGLVQLADAAAEFAAAAAEQAAEGTEDEDAEDEGAEDA